jgi:hypothetical protein
MVVNDKREMFPMKGIPLPFVRANQWFIFGTVVISLLTKQHYLLTIPLLVGLFSLLFKKNPVFYIVAPFLKKPLTSYLQEDRAQQQFNQWISVICLALSLLGFIAAFPIIGYIFAIMVAVASLVAILGFCIGCFIRFQYLKWKHKRNQHGTPM